MNTKTLKTLILALFLAVGCADPSEPEPVTPPPPPVTVKLVCPSFTTVTQVAGISASQGAVTAHSCDNALGSAPQLLTLLDGKLPAGTATGDRDGQGVDSTVSGVEGVVDGDSCTFTFDLVRSCEYQIGSCCLYYNAATGSCEASSCTYENKTATTSYTVTVPVVSK